MKTTLLILAASLVLLYLTTSALIEVFAPINAVLGGAA